MSLRAPLSAGFTHLTTEIGVYAVCDLDEIPVYVGQTRSIGERGILGRVRRHLTSARSDIIASRQLDVWELAYVWAWPISRENIDEFERQVRCHLLGQGCPLGGKNLAQPLETLASLPDYQRVYILDPTEIEKRKDVRLRFPRQVQQIGAMLDFMLNVKDTPDMRQSLAYHMKRLGARYQSFMTAAEPDVPESSDEVAQD